MTIWDNLKDQAQKVGKATSLAAQRTKIRADLLLLDRERNGRKHSFGIEMFNLMEELENREGHDFWEKHNDAVSNLRGPYTKAKQEIHEYVGRINGKVTQLSFVEEKRANAFPTPASTFGEKMKNAGKSASMVGSEAKLKSQMALINSKMKARKQEFGLELYDMLAYFEDNNGWLPSDRDMRSCYDRARQDICEVEKKRDVKVKELIALGGTIHQTSTEQQQQGGGGFVQQQQQQQQQQQESLSSHNGTYDVDDRNPNNTQKDYDSNGNSTLSDTMTSSNNNDII